MSEDNILEELDDDYVGSAKYYDDEERRFYCTIAWPIRK